MHREQALMWELWWQALQRQQADGHFLVGAVIFVVAATRPVCRP